MLRTSLLAAVTVSGLAMVAAPSWAGSISGTLTLKGAASSTRPASSGDARPAKLAAEASEAVVYLQQIPDKVEKKLAKKAETAHMAQDHKTFIPKTLAIPAGTLVEFENQDRVYHNIFSVSPVRRFDLGKYAPRERYEVRFDKPGVIQVFCDLHPKEFGYICVTPNHAYARPDSTGAFQLPAKLPAGNYRLVVWHPRFGKATRDVVMPKKGDVDVALKL